LTPWARPRYATLADESGTTKDDMAEISPWLEAILKWIHVVAGVLWIGLLYFFNWVNGPFQGKMDGDTKKKVNPELLPRALYFFRWGAAYTWITGLLLLAVLYYHPFKSMMAQPEHAAGAGTALGIAAAIALGGWLVYDILWKSMAKNESMGVLVSLVLVVAVIAVMHFVGHVSARALYIHVGGMFGTAMAFNVWMRIWPSQRKIIAAVKDGKAPDAAIVSLAGLRSKHNTYMSVPLVFTMIVPHASSFYGFMGDMGWVLLVGVIVVGWGVTKLVYKKAASPAPAEYAPPAA
jgi:uncharacterized membrane protein